MDFTVRRDDQPYPALLIDVEGGKSRTTRFNGQPVYDDTPVQALVLTPEGNLEIHTNLADKEDPERKKRYEDWKSRLEDVRNPNKRKKDQNKLFDNKGPAQ